MLSIYRGSLVVFLFMISSIVNAQIPKEPKNVQSPNAMSFGMFGDIPVSYYSGVPSIQVPLYTFKENEISIPINLSYHAAGFRPDVHPGWVGLNWNLTAGGVITRTVRDMRDDYSYSDIPANWRGYWYYHNVNDNANWETNSYLLSIVNSSPNSVGDTEPDEFSFNFPGYSGKFYLDHLGKWKVSCDRPLKVEFDGKTPQTFLPDFQDGNYNFSGFTIIDEYGNKYIFGKDPAAIEYGTSFFAGNDIWTAQAWYLTRIIHADGYEVAFKYERDDYINQMYSAYSRVTSFYDENSGFPSTDCPHAPNAPFNLVSSYSGKLISPVYLSSIEGSNETIKFKRSTSTELRYSTATGVNDYQNPYEYRRSQVESQLGPLQATARLLQQSPGMAAIQDFYPSLNKLKFKQLDTIEIQDRNGAKQKVFKLFFTSSTSKRLTLDSLREIGSGGEIKPCFKFAYKPYQGGEPKYLDNKTDHWGFYNNQYADPTASNLYDLKDVVSTSHVLSAMIDSIIYPTGGVTKFTFEGHKYYKRVQEIATRGIDNSITPTNTLAGGLRIQKIESYDKTAPAQKKSKEYFYVNNYTTSSNISSDPSSGVLGSRIRYQFDDYSLPVYGDPTSRYTKFCVSSQTVLPACENSLGTHVGYSEVVEKLSDGSYSKFYFNNYDNGHLDDSALIVQNRTAYQRVNSRAIERGTLSRQEDYSNTNSLLKKRLIDYIALNKANEYVRAINGGIFRVCSGEGSTAQAFEGTAYKFYTYSYLPKSEITTEYSQGTSDSLVTRKYMYYNDTTRLLVKDSTVTSKSEPLCNYYYYPVEVINYTPAANAPHFSDNGIYEAEQHDRKPYSNDCYKKNWLIGECYRNQSDYVSALRRISQAI